MEKLRINGEFAKRHLAVAVLMLGMSGWFGYDAFVTYPRLSAEALYEKIERSKPSDQLSGERLETFKRQKILSQRGFMALTALVGIVVGLHLWAVKRFSLEFDETGFVLAGKRYAFGDITALDERKWTSRGFAFLQLKNGKRFRLDRWHHLGAKEFYAQMKTAQGGESRVMVVASHNSHKLREIGELLVGWEILADNPEVEETGTTFEENALIKLRAVKGRHPGAWCMADDSGLEVDALKGEPGVYSARYAGEDGNTPANNAKLLKKLEGVERRTARFVCVVALSDPSGAEHLLRGTCEGAINYGAKGPGGFGYDPLFVPKGFTKTFAELTADEKNAISHRGNALKKVLEILEKVGV